MRTKKITYKKTIRLSEEVNAMLSEKAQLNNLSESTYVEKLIRKEYKNSAVTLPSAKTLFELQEQVNQIKKRISRYSQEEFDTHKIQFKLNQIKQYSKEGIAQNGNR